VLETSWEEGWSFCWERLISSRKEINVIWYNIILVHVPFGIRRCYFHWNNSLFSYRFDEVGIYLDEVFKEIHSWSENVIFRNVVVCLLLIGNCFHSDLMKLESIQMKCIMRSKAGVKMFYIVMLWLFVVVDRELLLMYHLRLSFFHNSLVIDIRPRTAPWMNCLLLIQNSTKVWLISK